MLAASAICCALRTVLPSSTSSTRLVCCALILLCYGIAHDFGVNNPTFRGHGAKLLSKAAFCAKGRCTCNLVPHPMVRHSPAMYLTPTSEGGSRESLCLACNRRLHLLLELVVAHRRRLVAVVPIAVATAPRLPRQWSAREASAVGRWRPRADTRRFHLESWGSRGKLEHRSAAAGACL